MSIKSIYRRAWDITYKNKPLWVIGMVLAALSGGSASSSSSSISRNLPKSTGSGLPTEATSSAISNSAGVLLGFTLDLIRSIPPYLWLALGIAFVSAVIFGIVISIVVRSWATGALIGGTDDAIKNQTPSLHSASEHGIKNLKQMVWLSVIPWLIYSLMLLAGTLIGALLTFLLANSPAIIFAVILSGLIGIAALILSIILTISQIWATRLVILEHLEPKAALFAGWKLAKKHLSKMLLLGGANCLTGCGVGCLTMIALIPIAGIVIGIFSIKSNAALFLLPIAGLLFLLVIIAGTLVNGIYQVFKYTTWNLLYQEIRGSSTVEVPEITEIVPNEPYAATPVAALPDSTRPQFAEGDEDRVELARRDR